MDAGDGRDDPSPGNEIANDDDDDDDDDALPPQRAEAGDGRGNPPKGVVVPRWPLPPATIAIDDVVAPPGPKPRKDEEAALSLFRNEVEVEVDDDDEEDELDRLLDLEEAEEENDDDGGGTGANPENGSEVDDVPPTPDDAWERVDAVVGRCRCRDASSSLGNDDRKEEPNILVLFGEKGSTCGP